MAMLKRSVLGLLAHPLGIHCLPVNWCGQGVKGQWWFLPLSISALFIFPRCGLPHSPGGCFRLERRLNSAKQPASAWQRVSAPVDLQTSNETIWYEIWELPQQHPTELTWIHRMQMMQKNAKDYRIQCWQVWLRVTRAAWQHINICDGTKHLQHRPTHSRTIQPALTSALVLFVGLVQQGSHICIAIVTRKMPHCPYLL